jgi:hypothetical protein
MANFLAQGLRKMFGGGSSTPPADSGKGLRKPAPSDDDDTDIKSTDDIGTKLKKRNKVLDNVMKDM